MLSRNHKFVHSGLKNFNANLPQFYIDTRLKIYKMHMKSALHAVKFWYQIFIISICKMWIASFWHTFHILSFKCIRLHVFHKLVRMNERFVLYILFLLVVTALVHYLYLSVAMFFSISCQIHA